MATTNSKATRRKCLIQRLKKPLDSARPSLKRPSIIVLCLALAVTTLPRSRAGQEQNPDIRHRTRALKIYEDSRALYQANPSKASNAWEFARACYDLADLAPDDTRRSELARQGIEACRLAQQKHPRIAPIPYYLALNIGQEARTKMLSALGLVNEMEKQFLRTIELDTNFDYAGAHRAIAILYRDAPGWPVSVGSKSKSKIHLEKALALFPNYPGNQIVLLESLLEWDELDAARKKLGSVRKILKAARQEFAGEAWALSWKEWDQKWSEILTKLEGAKITD